MSEYQHYFSQDVVEISEYDYYFPSDDELLSEDEDIPSPPNHLESSVVKSPSVAGSRNEGIMVPTNQEKNTGVLAHSSQYQQLAGSTGQGVDGDTPATQSTWQSVQTSFQSVSDSPRSSQVPAATTPPSATQKGEKAPRQSAFKSAPRKRAIKPPTQPTKKEKLMSTKSELIWVEVHPEQVASGSSKRLKRGNGVKAHGHQHMSSSQSYGGPYQLRHVTTPASGIASKSHPAGLQSAPAMQSPVADNVQQHPYYQQSPLQSATDGYFYPPPPSTDGQNDMYGTPYPTSYSAPLANPDIYDGTASSVDLNMLPGQTEAPAMPSAPAHNNTPWSKMDTQNIDPQLLALDQASSVGGVHHSHQGPLTTTSNMRKTKYESLPSTNKTPSRKRPATLQKTEGLPNTRQTMVGSFQAQGLIAPLHPDQQALFAGGSVASTLNTYPQAEWKGNLNQQLAHGHGQDRIPLPGDDGHSSHAGTRGMLNVLKDRKPSR